MGLTRICWDTAVCLLNNADFLLTLASPSLDLELLLVPSLSFSIIMLYLETRTLMANILRAVFLK